MNKFRLTQLWCLGLMLCLACAGLVAADAPQSGKTRLLDLGVRQWLPSVHALLYPNLTFGQYLQATAPARAHRGLMGDTKLAIRPVNRPERPRMAIASVFDEPDMRPSVDQFGEGPAPGEGITRDDLVTIADPALEVVTSELDPNIPLTMKKPMPKWVEEIEEELNRDKNIEVPRGEDLGPEVDLSAPGTPMSSLQPLADDNMSRALGSLATGYQSYPNGSPSGGPPDVSLTVGETYVIAGYNSYFAVYNKGTGANVANFNMSSLFAGTGSICSSPYMICDPQVVYDDFNGGSCPSPTDPRYILVALAADSSGDGVVCIAVSKSGAAPTSTGNFWKYEYNPLGATTGLPDYPKVAVSSDAVLVGYNWFGSGYGYGAALTKSALYAGTPPTVREYNWSPYQTPWPAVRVGCKQAQVPTYTGSHWTTKTGTSLQLWRWPTPSTSNNPGTYGGTLASATNCTNPTGSYIATTYPIDCMYGQWMDPEQRGDYLFAVRASTGGAGSALTWAKINVSGGTPSATTGTVTETGNYLWMPSVASDRDYDFGLAFTRASQTNSIRASGAVAGSEGGTWGSVIVSQAGNAAFVGVTDQSNTYYRWGDYSGFAPDPIDGCTLWANTQYSKSGYPIRDASWIQPFKFAACTSAPQAFLDRSNYHCFQTVQGSIIDLGGTPTNAVYHASNGRTIPAAISGGPNNYTVAPITINELGAVDGNNIWLSFTGSDAANHNSTNSIVACAVAVCVSSVDTPTGGCDSDEYLDTGETINLFVRMVNNENFALPTGFTATLTSSDGNITIVTPTAEYPALDVGEISGPVGIPFQVRVTGGTNIRTINFTVSNIQATDGSWSSGGCVVGSNLFTEIARANNQLGTSYTQFPESWDGASFPPTNWAIVDVTGTLLNWARTTQTAHPAGSAPQSASYMAFVDCWTDPNASGNQVRLQRSANTDASAAALVAGSVWMFHESQYTNDDTIQVQASGDGGSTWTNVGAVLHRNQLYGGANKTWTQHIVDVSSVCGNQNDCRIGLLATSDYGNDVYVDGVNLAPINRVADTSTCTGAPVITLSSSYQGPGYGYFLYDTQCNANGYPDRNETGTMLFYLSNTGNENAYGVTATLTCPSCPAGVTICDSTATYGDIPAGSGYNYAVADDGFRVALNGTVTDGTKLPWVITVNATNPYTTTINVPPTQAAGSEDHYFKSWSGTPTLVDNGDPYGYSIADYFMTAPRTAGTNGRYGFSTAWTATTGVTMVASATDPLGIGTVAQMAGKSGTGDQTMAHTFSTANVDTDISAYWLFNYGKARSDSLFFFEWTNNGTTWNNFIPGGTGQPGAGGTADAWVQYGYVSLYSIAYNSTVAGYGPVTANAMLNNASFGVRFRIHFGSNTATSWQISPFWLDQTGYVDEVTTCAGTCLGPEAAVITEVRDLNPCSLTGVQIYFDKGMGTTSTDLLRNGSSVVTGYTSGTTYSPGDSTSYNYAIHSINNNGTIDSSPTVAGSDATSSGQYFTCNPSNCTNVGGNVTLTAPAGYTPYQWYLNGSTISGATTSTYTATANGNYAVSFTSGACGVATSPVTAVTAGGGCSMTVDVTPNSPATVCTGTNIVFTATQSGGSGSITYQWTENGANIGGANSSTYTANKAGAGTFVYNCKVSATGCTDIVDAASPSATWVAPPTTVDVTPNGTTTVCTGVNIVFTATVTGGATPLYQWTENGSNISGATNSTYTANKAGAGSFTYNCKVNNTGCATTTQDVTNSTGAWVAPPSSVTVTPSGTTTVCTGTNIVFTATVVGGATPVYQWTENGSNISGATNSTYTANKAAAGPFNYTCVVYNTGCATTVTDATPSTGTWVAPPSSVTVTPSGTTTVCTGSNIVFTATVVGGATPVYQWTEDGSNISGATNSTYTANKATAQSHTYTCVVYNTGCATTVTDATPSTGTWVAAPTSVDVTPNGTTTVCSGANIVFTAAVTGGVTPSYQWTENGSNIGGATNSTYTANKAGAGSFTYNCVVTNAGCGTPTTDASASTGTWVAPPSSVTVTPSGTTTVCTGSNIVFTATVVGGATPQYQWTENGTNIAGATNSTYTANKGAAGSFNFTCVVNNTGCATTVTDATPSTGTWVAPPSSVTVTPSGTTTVCTGSNIVFTATVVGGATPVYQWTENGSNIGGATNSTYTANKAAAGSFTYTCVVYNTGCATTVTDATPSTGTWVAPPTVDVTPNGTTSVTVGNNIVFTATAGGGTAPYSYQWTEDGGDISGGTNSTLTRNYGTVQTHTYNCKVTSTGCATVGTDATASTGEWTAIVIAPEVTNAYAVRNGSNVDITFDEMGTYNYYNIYVSNVANTHPFAVNAGADGHVNCNVVTTDNGTTRTVGNFDLSTGITGATDTLFFLITADHGASEGTLGSDSTPLARTADSNCP